MKDWKQIPDFPEYEVSRRGEVRHKSAHHKHKKPKLLKPWNNGTGYFVISLCKNGKRKNKLVSRLVAEAFVPNHDNLPEVNHKDHVKENNIWLNLEWCTSSYNKLYAHACGRFPKRDGNKCNLATLSAPEVLEIRQMHEENPSLTYKEIGEKFGVQASSIGKIIRREQWKHI
jgi:hypothetical protein